MRRLAYRALSRWAYSLFRPAYLRAREDLAESQWWNAERLSALQDERLARLIAHAYGHVPYYRECMRGLGLSPANVRGRADLHKLPILTKADVIRYGKALTAETPAAQPSGIRSSGGSTGEPVRVLVDAGSSFQESAAYLRGLSFAGYGDGDAIVLLFGGSMGSVRPSLTRRLWSKLAGETLLPAFDIRTETAVEYFERIRDSRAKYLNGYTSAIHLLACAFEKRGLRLNLGGVFPTSETLYDFQKEAIEAAFGARTFNLYGCCEANSIAFECEAHDGLHVTEENVVVEVLRDEKEVPAGAPGALTLTTLNNFAMPLIRYQNEDVVSLRVGQCSCGRGLGRLAEVHGRANDLLRAMDGTLLSGAFIPYLFKTTEGIREMQVIQELEDRVVVKVVKNDQFDEGDLERRIALLRGYLGPVNVEVRFVEAIERTPSGKRTSVVSRFGRSVLAAREGNG